MASISIKTSLLLALFGYSVSTFATVGGDTKLQVLGYEPTEKKIYVLHDFYDGLGGYQLYYFNLKSKNPRKLIEAKSYYPKGMGGRGHPDDEVFVAKMDTLTKRLLPLKTISTDNVSIKILSKQTKRAYNHITERSIPAYHYQYRVKYGKYQSQTMKVVAYYPKLEISQAFVVPNQNQVVVVVDYNNDYFEGGYFKEDPVLISW